MQNLRDAAAKANKSGQSASPLKSKLSPAQAVLLGGAFEQVGAGSEHTHALDGQAGRRHLGPYVTSHLHTRTSRWVTTRLLQRCTYSTASAARRRCPTGSATARDLCLLRLTRWALGSAISLWRSCRAAQSPERGRGTGISLGRCCGFMRLCAAGSCTAAHLPSRAFKVEVIDLLIPQPDEVRHVYMYMHAMHFGREPHIL